MKEELGEGQAVERDEAGQFSAAELSSERAKEIGAMATPARKREQDATALGEQILKILPPLDDPDKQAVRESLLRQYARHTFEKGQASLTAIEGIARLIGDALTAQPARMPTAIVGLPCPSCGKLVGDPKLSLSPEAYAYLRKLMLDAAPGLLAEAE